MFRTSCYKSQSEENILGLPTFSRDGFRGVFLGKESPHLSFCGCPRTHKIREDVISFLLDKKISEFIIRDTFHAKGIDPHVAWEDFVQNMQSSLYALCVRGTGNFSYRLGEAFMMGRVPVILDTDMLLPFENILPYKDNCIMVSQKEDIENEIFNFHDSHSENELLNIQKNNREVWKKYFTPIGFVNHIDEVLL